MAFQFETDDNQFIRKTNANLGDGVQATISNDILEIMFLLIIW